MLLTSFACSPNCQNCINSSACPNKLLNSQQVGVTNATRHKAMLTNIAEFSRLCQLIPLEVKRELFIFICGCFPLDTSWGSLTELPCSIDLLIICLIVWGGCAAMDVFTCAPIAPVRQSLIGGLSLWNIAVPNWKHVNCVRRPQHCLHWLGSCGWS